MAITQEPVTLEAFLELPEQKPALEFFDGRVVQKVSPKTRHSWLQFELCRRINQATGPLRRALALPELRTTYGGASTVPDVAVYRWERLPLDQTGELLDNVTMPPDVAIEIVSPEQSVNSLVRKSLWYLANGVELSLLVDPYDRSVLVFQAGQEPRALHGAERFDLGEVVPGFSVGVEELFLTLRFGEPRQAD